ncbi:MAG: crossover junction endodeoxyribonuclease RuvC [Actinomycetota bacterium]|nr:crossover junction endodeoxyribonuclease RuvC [Actinomycetota bacterium]
MIPAVAGIDLSLTAPGLATAAGVAVLKPKTTGTQRLIVIRDWIVDVVDTNTVAVLEGYAFGRPNQAHHLGELGGVVRVALAERDITTWIAAPATIKKFATGRGNARKPDMLDASRRAGYEGSNDDNAVDAWWLYQYGLYVLGAPEVDRFSYRDDVVHTAGHHVQGAAL